MADVGSIEKMWASMGQKGPGREWVSETAADMRLAWVLQAVGKLRRV